MKEKVKVLKADLSEGYLWRKKFSAKEEIPRWKVHTAWPMIPGYNTKHKTQIIKHKTQNTKLWKYMQDHNFTYTHRITVDWIRVSQMC